MGASRLLIPDWADLRPSRPIYLWLWPLAVIVLTSSWHRFVGQLPSVPLAIVLAGTLISAVGIVLLSGSLRLAHLTAFGAGSTIGLASVSWRARQTQPLSSAALPHAICLAGCLLVGQVNSFSDVPLASYLCGALATLSLWPVLLAHVRRRPAPKTLVALVIGVPAACCAVAIGLALAAEM